MSGDVVCGVNGSTSSRRALLEAVRRASATGDRVTVVTAYDAVGYFWGALASLPGGNLLPVPHRSEVQAAEEATLRAFVGEVLGDRPPPVPVAVRAVAGRPVDVLVRESAGAAQLIVGHGTDRGRLTSVAAGCARRVRCPVVVVGTSPSAPEPVR
ncbi:universal stress protein [Actinomycetospora straminea]|uniref:UspA domain-containing protein n=1 Tax=Actinomycetospora straminea TaxID=663607 RepID=A0ABP9EKV1_9PSEU|nr:universal stress protein [Actinomycetospora straminea]MDD7933157.1 universal stress protein [Actinomycetospora straminea]